MPTEIYKPAKPVRLFLFFGISNLNKSSSFEILHPLGSFFRFYVAIKKKQAVYYLVINSLTFRHEGYSVIKDNYFKLFGRFHVDNSSRLSDIKK